MCIRDRGAAVRQMEKRGIQTNIGNLNREIRAANRLMKSIRQLIHNLKGWIDVYKRQVLFWQIYTFYILLKWRMKRTIMTVSYTHLDVYKRQHKHGTIETC